MPIVCIVEVSDAEDVDMRAQYARAADELNAGRPFTEPADWGGGLISHVAAVGDGGGIIVDVWEDRAHMDAWMQRVAPLLEDAPNPRIRIMETINVVTGAPVRA
jgi:hypothetical protein